MAENNNDGPAAYYDDDGVLTIRASAYGSCPRKLWSYLNDIQPTEREDATLRVFAEGHLHEAAVTKTLEAEGYKITGDQTEIVLKVLKNKLHIVGHIDGFIELGESPDFDASEYGEKRLWECKSASKDSFKDWINGGFNAKPGYAWQLAIYMFGTGFTEAHYSTKRRDDGLIDTQLVDEPPRTMKQIRARAIQLYKALTSPDMPSCEDDGFMYFCEFWFLHDEQDVDEPELKIPADNIPELDDLLGGYYEAAETEKWAKGEKDRIKKKLQDEFRNGRMTFGSDGFTVKVSAVKGSTFDKASAKSENPEFIEKHTKVNPYERWAVGPRKG